MRAGVRGLRAQRLIERIVAALSATTRTRSEAFRVLEFSIQDDHVHLLAEANDTRALACGVRALAIRIARSVNRALGRRGRLWADRYHARSLRTPRAVRNALVYVLANHRKHGVSVAGIDPCSSGPWFRGWRDELRTVYARDDVRRWRGVPAPTAAARTWLASTGWTRHGLLAVDEQPVTVD